MRTYRSLFLPLFLGLSLISCDIFTPQKTFRLAVPESDFTYNITAGHLKSFLEVGGFPIEIVHTANAIEANRLVANGEADLTFVMNHSDFIPEAVGPEARMLRTIAPMFNRLAFLFSREPIADSVSVLDLLAKKRLGLEVLDGETHTNFKSLFQTNLLNEIIFVNQNESPDLIHFWGTYYGPRATSLLREGWHEVSLNPAWIDYICLNNPSLSPFSLPAVPGVRGSKVLNTVSVQTLLVGNSDIGENSIYNLSQYIYQHRLELMGFDQAYRTINENFDASTILYPAHEGTDAYLRRDEPSFFERYAEVMALVFSIGAVLYGLAQALRNRLARQKKERIDLYFLDFLDIRTKSISEEEKRTQLDSLLQKALVQMTAEKLDKGDFHIFSRLIQQELSNLRR